jgi:hypothetical protein
MANLRFFVTQEGTLNQGGSGKDTIFNFTGQFSSDTVKGAGGNDLISFANQTTAVGIHGGITALGSAGSFTAGFAKAIYSGANVAAGVIAANLTAISSMSAAVTGTYREVSATVQSLQQTGIATIRGGVIGGNTGNDSIYLGDQVTTFNKAFVGGGAGNDLLGTFNSGASTAGFLNANFSGSTIAGGNGNDTVFVNLSAGSATENLLAGNSGNDSVMLSSTNAEINSGRILGGGGTDSVVVDIDTAKNVTIRGGDGKDSIDLTFSAGRVSTLIEGDSTNGSGADTIRIQMGLAGNSSNTINGGDGADSIVLSGTTAADGGSNILNAGTGADTVFFQSAGEGYLSGATIKGQMGNDSILIQSMSAGTVNSSIIYGNKGNDTITLGGLADAANRGRSAGSQNLTIQGGAGADLLTNSGFNTAGGTGIFAYKSLSDSTLDSMDTVLFSTAAVSAGATTNVFVSSQVRIHVATGSLSLASGGSGAVSASSGYIVWSGYSDNSLTARVSAIDANITTTGAAAVFTTDNSTRFLFVQGGATDLVVKLASADNLSAGQANVAVSGAIIGFGEG